jgi:hypothetical protein
MLNFRGDKAKGREFWEILGERVGGGAHFWTEARENAVQKVCILSPFGP